MQSAGGDDEQVKTGAAAAKLLASEGAEMRVQAWNQLQGLTAYVHNSHGRVRVSGSGSCSR